MDIVKRCWVEIDLNQIKNNYLIYKSYLLNNQQVMAVVKADAYGHGDVEVAHALSELGVVNFAVSNQVTVLFALKYILIDNEDVLLFILILLSVNVVVFFTAIFNLLYKYFNSTKK